MRWSAGHIVYYHGLRTSHVSPRPHCCQDICWPMLSVRGGAGRALVVNWLTLPVTGGSRWAVRGERTRTGLAVLCPPLSSPHMRRQPPPPPTQQQPADTPTSHYNALYYRPTDRPPAQRGVEWSVTFWLGTPLSPLSMLHLNEQPLREGRGQPCHCNSEMILTSSRCDVCCQPLLTWSLSLDHHHTFYPNMLLVATKYF